ncbi:MAG: protoporphyrinogen oxidase HemJ [Alphaproteobacteria bacterium]
MIEFLNEYYNWWLAMHILSFVSWMAGLLYLPRLFVYHAYSKPGSDQSETFKIMERRLYKYIMHPAMVASWVFGLIMLYARWELLIFTGWMQVKLVCVVIMTLFHFLMIKYLEDFEDDKNEKSHVYFRVLNEVPTVIMIVIVICAIVQPF